MYTPTGRILVHENDVFFDTPGDEAFVDAHSNGHDDTDVDIETATDRCVSWANAHHYVCSANADPDANTRPSHYGPCNKSETPRDYNALRPRFAWLPTDIIKKTFEVTTQYARMPLNTILRKCFKSPNPAVNIRRRDEPIATETIQSDVPAIDVGEKYAQLFIRMKSLVSHVHGMKSPAAIPNSETTLQHYSRLDRCSSLLLAPLLDVRVLRVEQHFLGGHPVYPSSPGLRH
jgi:hypothetical protein